MTEKPWMGWKLEHYKESKLCYPFDDTTSLCGPAFSIGAHITRCKCVFLCVLQSCGILSQPGSESTESVVLSACNLKSACVSVLDSSVKQCNYLSTLLYRLHVSNVLINHRDTSEMGTVSVNKVANFVTPSCCVPSCWIFSSHLLEVLPVCLFLLPVWTAGGHRRKGRNCVWAVIPDLNEVLMQQYFLL